MKVKSFFIISLSILVLLFTFSSCTKKKDVVPSMGEQNAVAGDDANSEKIERITDEAGKFIYEGKTQQIGDNEHGFIKVPADFVRFKDAEVNGLVQYSDISGKNVITLNHYKGVNFISAALRLYAGISSEKEGIEGLTYDSVSIAGYNANQVSGYYPDGYYFVAWLIEDPADPLDSYYLTFEYDKAHENIMAFSSTFRAANDSNGKGDVAPSVKDQAQSNELGQVTNERITDETGKFIYEGKLQQIGDNDHGYMKVPPHYQFSKEDAARGILRYSDTSGKGVITLNLFKGMDYHSAAQKLYLGIDAQSGIEGLTGATVHPSGYNAKQIYGVNTEDGYFFVIWLIEDPDNSSNCYYLSLEFDEEHNNIMALSSTFRSVKDYNDGKK